MSDDRSIREVIADLLGVVELRLDRVEAVTEKIGAAGSDRYGAIMDRLVVMEQRLRTDNATALAVLKAELHTENTAINARVSELFETRVQAVKWVFGIFAVLICAGVIALISVR